jgi:RNA polymerase sigma factor (sigma-70 family)
VDESFTNDVNRLCVDNKRLAVFLARRIWLAARKKPDLDDMIADSFLGLVKAAQRYDPARGDFGSYAAKAINGAVIDGLPRATRIKLPAYLHTHMCSNEADEAMQQKEEDIWEVAEISELYLDKDEQAVISAKLEGYTRSEVCERLQITPARYRQLQEHAVMILREHVARVS